MALPAPHYEPSTEELTHRTAGRESLDTHVRYLSARLDQVVLSLSDAVVDAKQEAQTANDALQKLLEAAMAAGIKLADVRFASQETAIGKTETAIVAAKQAADIAVEIAVTSMKDALSQVNTKSEMRHDSAALLTDAVEHKIAERLTALQQIIDLRARMNEAAVEKANEANEKRFESVNEFRSTLSDQARDFVTTSVLTARTSQLESQIEALERQGRAVNETLQNAIAALNAQVASLASKLIVGGGALLVIVPVIQLILNLFHVKS